MARNQSECIVGPATISRAIPARRRSARSWPRSLLLSVAIGVALISVVVWGASTWGQPREQTLQATIAPGRSIHIEVWPIVYPDTPCDLYHPDCRRFHDLPLGGRWLNIWYQDRATQTLIRLAVLTLPAWPLLVFAAGAALAIPLVHILLRSNGWWSVRASERPPIIRSLRH